jgi:hypothetical protein
MENQIELLGYKTKHFDICKRAVEVFSDIKEMLPQLSAKARSEVLAAVKAQDEAFKIEKSLYETAIENEYSDSVEEAYMLFILSIYSIGKISEELEIDLIEMFDYIPMHLEQIRHPTKSINPALPKKEMEEQKMIRKEYGEGRMARASLRKIIMYAGELLAHIRPEDELEGWTQAKISDMDHSIEAVYTYYKFGEKYDAKPQPVHEYENEIEEYDEAPKPPSVNHMCALSVKHETLGFGMCIPTTHSLNEKGEVHFYDVVFSNGIAKGVPAKELTIIESKSHMHDY